MPEVKAIEFGPDYGPGGEPLSTDVATPSPDDPLSAVVATCARCGADIVRVDRDTWLHVGEPTRAGAQPVRYRHCASTPTGRAPATTAEPDPVNHPGHYTTIIGGRRVDAIDAIEALNLGFRLGNALKYLWRAGRKEGADTVEDLRKARWYIDREIAHLTQQPTE